MKTLVVLIGFGFCCASQAATYAITAVRVISTASAASSACNTAEACNGTVIEIDTSSSLATGGTYALGFSQANNNNPSSAAIVLSVTSSGYSDCSGTPGTVSRTVYGTKQLRQPYPNQLSNDETSSGGTLTLRVALSDTIYQGDTVTATIAASIYTSGSDSTVSYSGSVTNSSTVPYSRARAIANWSGVGWQRITGSSFRVRAVGFHRHARAGLQLACMVFTATDQHSHTVTVNVQRPTIDYGAGMGDYSAIAEYVADVSTATLDQGDQVTVHFKAYPWVGDSGAVMDTSDGVNAQPHARYAPQYYIIDKTGAYGSVVSVVDPSTGSDSNSCAVTEASFDSGSPPAACATINGAAVKMAALNQSTYSRNEASGTMYLKAGNYNWMGASAAASNTTAKVWMTVTPFPGVSSASVVINGQSGSKSFGTRCTTGSTNCGTPVRVKGLTLNVTSAPVSVFDGITYLWLDGNSVSMNGTAPVYQNTVVYATGNTFTTLSNGWGPFSTVNSSWALVRGNDAGSVNRIVGYTVLANKNSTKHQLQITFEVSGGGSPASTQPIIYGNRWMNVDVSAAPILFVWTSFGSSPIGAAIIQNVWESTTTSNTLLLAVAHDSSTVTPVFNVMFAHNVIVGGRINRFYNDNGSTARVRSLTMTFGEIRDQEAIKADTFATENAARVGNWQVLYGSGRYASYNLEPTGWSAAGSFQLEFGGLYTYNPSSTGGQPPSSSTNAVSAIKFVSRAAYDGSVGGSGNGDYRLTSASPAIAMIPAGLAVLSYDMDGQVRRLDGYGSAGPFEQAMVLTSPLW